jgi:hypothetical protein
MSAISSPSPNLSWQCANLTVPMDYLVNTNNKTTEIYIAKVHPEGLNKPLGGVFAAGPIGYSYPQNLILCTYSSQIFSYLGNAFILPTILNVTNSQFDVILVDQRGVRIFRLQSLIRIDWSVECTGLRRISGYSWIHQSREHYRAIDRSNHYFL